eukprot:TRINITY_DN2448_c0_g1_i1.p1 TRINITY_DN2448_c0_g1~~TRINITY_DN2448_c0_g1_i1.p1  ORF type:complete len:502 (-),score=132.29 TRINITY_DN2448_c0_g1_i1:197-1702(-)
MSRHIDIFLNANQKQYFLDYSYQKLDLSISTRILYPFWVLLAKLFPPNVAPNVLPLAGVISLIQAWYLSYNYIDLYPTPVSLAATFLIFAYFTLDGVVPIHAKNIRNESSLVAFFKEVADNVAVVFVILTICEVMGLKDFSLQWYCVQIAQILFLQQHLKALVSNVTRYPLLAGPGEALFVFVVLMIVRGIFGLGFIISIWHKAFSIFSPVFNTIGMPETSIDEMIIYTIYYGLLGRALVIALTLPKEHQVTRNGVVLCLLYRLVPALLIQFLFQSGLPHSITVQAVLADGLFMSIITSDICLSKMSNRELHPWIVIFTMISLINYFLIIVLVVFYYSIVFYELSVFTHLPLLTVCRNVYVDGIFDLCHIGHKNLFKNALLFGNRLLVGVINDVDASKYKRRPIMTYEERMAEVQGCKGVYEVIGDAPCFGLNEEFIKKHNIHIVAHSVEYDTPTDKYYAIPRKMGIARVLPRTQGLSTTELIRRVKDYGSVESNNVPKKS